MNSKSRMPNRYVGATAAAEIYGRSISAFWRGVAAGKIPAPLYPTARAPRWNVQELANAIDASRTPLENQPAKRRGNKLAQKLA